MLVKKEKNDLWKVHYLRKVKWLMRSGFLDKEGKKEGDSFSSQE